MPGLSDTSLNPTLSFHENLNQQAAIVIQIESYEGIKNLDAILTQFGEHIDSVWLGSFDARISMGIKGGGLLGQEEEWIEAVRLYEGTLAKHNKPASGLALGTPEMKEVMGRGKSFMVSGSDYYALLGQGTELGFPARKYEGIYKQL
jgi:4-hydroxy-2-oxoheptanedioate aldolase